METILIILGVIFVITLIFFFKDRNDMLKQNVDSHGGMIKKYSVLIKALLNDSKAELSRVERDRVIVSLRTTHTFSQFILIENFNQLEVYWSADIKTVGRFSKKWIFPSSLKQDIMVAAITNYMQEKVRRTFG